MTLPHLNLDRESILNELIRDHLKTKYKLSETEVEQYFKKETTIPETPLTIPATIFNDTLSPFEAIVKYLKENKTLRLVDIAKLTGRDQRAIGVTYRSAVKKQSAPFVLKQTLYALPLATLNDKTFTISEHLVKHLKDTYELTYHEIAVLLKRDDRTIWTIYKRAERKNR